MVVYRSALLFLVDSRFLGERGGARFLGERGGRPPILATLSLWEQKKGASLKARYADESYCVMYVSFESSGSGGIFRALEDIFIEDATKSTLC